MAPAPVGQLLCITSCMSLDEKSHAGLHSSSKSESGLLSPITPEKKQDRQKYAAVGDVSFWTQNEAVVDSDLDPLSELESDTEPEDPEDGDYSYDLPSSSLSKRRRAHKVFDSEDSDEEIPLNISSKRCRVQEVADSDFSDGDIPLRILLKRRQGQQLIQESMNSDTMDYDEQSRAVVSSEAWNANAAFMLLATEIHQHIARYLPTDRDITNYSLVCKNTAASITESVWRQRFLDAFDKIEGLSAAEFTSKYAFRMAQSRKWICFDLKKWASNISEKDRQKVVENQKLCLDMLRELILQSNAYESCDHNGEKVIVARNIHFIRTLVTPGTPSVSYLDIVDAVLNAQNDWMPDRISMAKDPNLLVMLTQLCLTSISLDPKCCNESISHFDMSQSQAYIAPYKQPVFIGEWKQRLNVRWLLHIVNFFKHHLKAGKGEGLFEHSYSALKPGQLPQPWLGMISPGSQKLRQHWKGIQTFIPVPDQMKLRANTDFHGIFPDETEGSQCFQDLDFFFNDEKFTRSEWPKAWERILKANPFNGAAQITIPASSKARSRLRSSKSAGSCAKQIATPDIKHFYGTSKGLSIAHFFGRLHSLPAQGPPSKKIHGFQRITFMKYYTRDGSIDPEGIWAYEGCVLPGGRIIVGRWWDAMADQSLPDEVYSGPFMFWNVERGVSEPFIREEEALEFLLANYEQML